MRNRILVVSDHQNVLEKLLMIFCFLSRFICFLKLKVIYRDNDVKPRFFKLIYPVYVLLVYVY